jgi:hypothetical protein
MSWYINGVEWTGTIKTVGSGKDYSNIADAFSVQASDALFLIDAGTYYKGSDFFKPSASYKRYVRGLGAVYSDVIIRSRIQADANFQDFVVENVDLNGVNWSSRDRIEYYANATGLMLFNKSRIVSNSGEIICAIVNCAPTITFQNSLLTHEFATYAHLYGTGPVSGVLTLTNISLSKVELSRALSSQYTAGSLAVNDCVTTPTAGYGISAGDFIISNAPPVATFKPRIFLF